MRGFYLRHGKRLADVVLGSAGLLTCAPLLLACACAIKADDRGPVLYTHQRAGRAGAPFTVYKLRTMRVGTDKIDGGFHTTAMVTRVGQFLRRTSLDELPQFLNVMKGDMSLVGPRPTLLDQVRLYSPQQRRRLDVRPGLTGLAQIRYRNSAPWSVRIEADIEYIESLSLKTDADILLRTIPAVLRGAGQHIADQKAEDVLDLGRTEGAS